MKMKHGYFYTCHAKPKLYMDRTNNPCRDFAKKC
jgi:hypothetical protein